MVNKQIKALCLLAHFIFKTTHEVGTIYYHFTLEEAKGRNSRKKKNSPLPRAVEERWNEY